MEDLIENAAALFDDQPRTFRRSLDGRSTNSANPTPRMQPLPISEPSTPSVESFRDDPFDTSPPLPEPPAGESTPFYPYGSVHTKVSSVPPPISTPASRTEPLPNVAPQQPPQTPVSTTRFAESGTTTTPTGASTSAFQPQSPETDFTPKLPPRPANSIHPSSRNMNSGNTNSGGSTGVKFPAQVKRLLPSSTLQQQQESVMAGRQTPPSPTKASLERAALARQLSEVEEAAEVDSNGADHEHTGANTIGTSSRRQSTDFRGSSGSNTEKKPLGTQARAPTFTQSVVNALADSSSPISPISVYTSAPHTPNEGTTGHEHNPFDDRSQ